MPVSDEHLKLLKKQMELVSNLREVVASQQRALEQLGDIDEDYENAQTKTAVDEDPAQQAEDDILAAALRKSETRKPRNQPKDDEEKAVKNVEYVEPTEEEERGFMATKPWLGAMAPPSNWSWDESGKRDEAPGLKLDLEHVYGYRSRLCRNNIAWVDADTIVFHVAAVGVVMNVKTREQKFFRGHDDDIICLSYNPAKRIVATGQQGKKPPMCIWSVDDPSKTIASFVCHQRAGQSTSISPDGSRVVSVGMDNEHSIAVHDLTNNQLIAMTKGDTNRILRAVWSTTTGSDPNTNFVSVGRKHIKFWSLSGSSLDSKKGLLGRKGEYQTFMSVNFTTDYSVVATAKGQMYCFENNKLKKIIDAHNGPCYCVSTDIPTNRLVTGGKDGFLNVWDRKTLKNTATFDMNGSDPCKGINSVRATWVDESHPDTILVGTAASSIYELNLRTGEITVLQRGHFGDLTAKGQYGELWGLATNPKDKNQFVSAGEDSTVRLWDISRKEQIARTDAGGAANCAAYTPDGKYIAVGFDNGSFGVYNSTDLSEVTSVKKAKRRIQCVRYSPCGKFFAAGDGDSLVRVYDVDGEDYNYKNKCKGNSSVILHVDFSDDSKYIQTCSQAYELLFYEVETGKQYVKSRDLKDQGWATFSSILGWNVQGIWPKEADGSDINMVNKSHSGKHLVTCEDSGLVRVFNYPCVGSGLDRRGKLGRRPDAVSGEGHSEHVTSAEFSADDSYIMSIGGADNAIFQWKVVA